MSGGFGVSTAELGRLQKDWQQMSQRMAELQAKLGKIQDTLAKAVAVDLAVSPLAGIAGFYIAYDVLNDAKDVENRARHLMETKEKLTKAIAADALKLQAVIREYQEAERRIAEEQKKQDKERETPDKPKPTGNGNGNGHGNGQGNGNGHGNGQGNGHGNGNGSGDHDGGGDNGGDASATPSTASAIKVSEVEYGGRGSWKSGRAACEDYINKTLDLMGVTDPQARANWMRGLLTMTGRESSYNSMPLVNDWDSNAHGPKVGDGFPQNCSRGPWQTIPSTFAAHHQPGTSTNIYDPVASCAAAMNYVMDRYGVSKDGHDLASKVQQADPGRGARGY
ncbi:hypothetical protein ACIA8O_18585 [Kitasatospora sp. NPDC051853]|uniref:hypothetical protein n=1 Tax=Kitasatospora sp. NPDC051853 TaxID=3364058 RepID=UPI00379F4CA9